MEKRGVLIGSLLGAMLASACCIGPLLMGELGLGSLGFAAALAPLRPWFLGLTTTVLAIGFHLAYRPKPAEACASDQACAAPASRRNQRVALWVVTALSVALAGYPAWGARHAAPLATAVAGRPGNTVVILNVQGMTCAACAGEIEVRLRSVPGVIRANVNFDRREAEVALSAGRPRVGQLIAAVEKAGYHATVAGQ